MRKRILLMMLVVTIFVSTSAEAQVKSNILKTSLTAPFLKTYTIAYEHAFNTDMSAQLGFNYFAGWKMGDSKLNGYSVTPEFRYYLSETKEAPNGGFIAPFGRFGSTGIKAGEVGDEDYGKADITIIGGGLLVGTQRIFKDVISLEAFIGPAYYNAKVSLEEGQEDDLNLNLIGGWTVRLGITIGIAF